MPYRHRALQATAAAGQLEQEPAEVRAEVVADEVTEVRGVGGSLRRKSILRHFVGVVGGRSGGKARSARRREVR